MVQYPEYPKQINEDPLTKGQFGSLHSESFSSAFTENDVSRRFFDEIEEICIDVKAKFSEDEKVDCIPNVRFSKQTVTFLLKNINSEDSESEVMCNHKSFTLLQTDDNLEGGNEDVSIINGLQISFDMENDELFLINIAFDLKCLINDIPSNYKIDILGEVTGKESSYIQVSFTPLDNDGEEIKTYLGLLIYSLEGKTQVRDTIGNKLKKISLELLNYGFNKSKRLLSEVNDYLGVR